MGNESMHAAALKPAVTARIIAMAILDGVLRVHNIRSFPI
jgi:hypothetical protein